MDNHDRVPRTNGTVWDVGTSETCSTFCVDVESYQRSHHATVKGEEKECDMVYKGLGMVGCF